MGKRGPKPKQLVDTTWRADLAYAVGLLAADGCLSSDGRHIELTSKDVDQLETFKFILGLEHIMTSAKSGGYSDNVCHRVEFGSVLFYQWLLSVGLTPNKSKTLKPITVPEEYYIHFVRGFFDGDGSVYAYWDPRWKSSYMYYLDFTSASRGFLEWMQQKNIRLCGVVGVVKDKGSRRAYVLRYAKKESAILFSHMYAQDHTPRLMRKFTKVQNIRMIDASPRE